MGSESEEALRKCEFLIVQDLFLTKTAQLADVVFPAACFAEKDGTYTNTERRVQRVRKAVNAPGEAKADWEIIDALMKRLGCDNGLKSSEDVFNEIRRLTPSYAGISYDRIEKLGSLQWPCPSEDHPGTPILYAEGFKNGSALLMPTDYQVPEEKTDAAHPFTLIAGTVLVAARALKSGDAHPGIFCAEINPKDAEKLSVCDGDMVLLESKRGSMEVAAKVTDDVKQNVVFIPVTIDDGKYGAFAPKTPAAFDFMDAAVSVKKI